MSGENKKKRLLVIGAGASGLPSIRHALFYENVEVTCFEKTDAIGGLWNFKPHETELASVMKSTVINTSKEMTAYSDFPPEERMATYMHNREINRYLNDYAKHFDLLKYIKFNHSVQKITRNHNYNETGQWKVDYLDDKNKNQSEVFDGILLCCGHHAIPHIPSWPGQDKFKGRIIHAHNYKDHRGYEDKNVVVVGIGNSGGDCAVELSRIAKQVYLVTRRGSWIFNRLFDEGKPTDLTLKSKWRFFLMSILPAWIFKRSAENMLNKRFDHEKYGLKPKHPPFSAHPTANDELPNRIANGTVRIKKSGIREFTENGIIFENGSKVDNIDEVILATGYSFNFNIVEDGNLIPVIENRLDAYKYIYPIQLSDHNSLGLIGLVQPLGSIMPVSEMQARVFLGHWAGSLKLPNRETMINDIKTKQILMSKRYVESRRHTVQVDFAPYMTELATMINANPNMLYLWLTDPRLAYYVLFGPCVSYIFRLTGSNIWRGARDAIFNVDYRVRMATSIEDSDNKKQQ
ncbi:unnamed protein product [Caenorhabditis angaria]|uniref:Flavin-containing monooxygenase n=1 Tax=Caenorhabditis angaria TaxID=860376 RepID=A0A9P1IIF0_9PELO|nr:unnamed protein product [Caenorhabditis angaria]